MASCRRLQDPTDLEDELSEWSPEEGSICSEAGELQCGSYDEIEAALGRFRGLPFQTPPQGPTPAAPQPASPRAVLPAGLDPVGNSAVAREATFWGTRGLPSQMADDLVLPFLDEQTDEEEDEETARPRRRNVSRHRTSSPSSAAVNSTSCCGAETPEVARPFQLEGEDEEYYDDEYYGELQFDEKEEEEEARSCCASSVASCSPAHGLLDGGGRTCNSVHSVNSSGRGSAPRAACPEVTPDAVEPQLHLPSPFMGWAVGQRYSMVRLLGHGSYGEVAEAYDNAMQRRVAIKRIINIFENDTDARRIYREMHILLHLQHPNVVTLFDVIQPLDYASFRDLYLVRRLKA